MIAVQKDIRRNITIMSPKKDMDKRIYPRFDIKKSKDFVFKLDYGKHKLLTLDPVNISVGGIGGYVYNGGENHTLDIGQDVTIYLYEQKEEMIKQKIDAKICWKYFDDKKGKVFIGKQFNVITLDAWQKLLDLTKIQN